MYTYVFCLTKASNKEYNYCCSLFLVKYVCYYIVCVHAKHGPSWIYNYLCTITTDVVSLNPDQGVVYNIMW